MAPSYHLIISTGQQAADISNFLKYLSLLRNSWRYPQKRRIVFRQVCTDLYLQISPKIRILNPLHILLQTICMSYKFNRVWVNAG